MPRLKTLADRRSWTDKKVLVRVDFNVPLKNGRVLDDFRLRATIPTIKYLLAHGARPILISHLKRPLGRPNPTFSLRLLVKPLRKLLRCPVAFSPTTTGPAALKAAKALPPGQVLLLENIRFLPGEEKNSRPLARALATLGDIYVNEAFSVSHRAHASVSAITDFLPTYAGLALEEEVKNISAILRPASPSVAVLGGAKISSKIGLIKNLARHFDTLLIGGALANNFIKSAGYSIGRSLIDDDQRLPISQYDFSQINLPLDTMVLTASGRATSRAIDAVGPREKILDIGPHTIKSFVAKIASAKTIVWNGPLGMSEDPRFSRGTRAIARAILKNRSACALIGGGETVAAFGRASRPRLFVSTAGGAMLKYLEGKVLPGIKPLLKK